jgi:hypothetical protein
MIDLPLSMERGWIVYIPKKSGGGEVEIAALF